MKRRLGKFTLLAVLSGAVTARAAIDFSDLTDGFELSAEAAQYPVQYRATQSLTLKLTGAAVDGTFEILSGFYIPEDVTVTIDTTGVTNALDTIRMKGGLRGTGVIAFGVGITNLTFGAAPTLSNILGDKNKMPALETAVTFTESTGSVEICEGVSLVRWPASYTIAEGTIIATMGANLFTNDTLVLDQGWDVMLNVTNAVKPGCKIVVPAGRTLYHRPCDLFPVEAPAAAHVQTWWGFVNATHEVDIDLQGGTFCTQAKTDNNIQGDVTGTGSIAFAQFGSLNFNGKMDFSGTVNLNALTAGQYCHFLTAAGSTFANVDFVFGNQASVLMFTPQTTNELVVKSVTATSVTPAIKIGAGGTVRFQTLTGSFVWEGGGGSVAAIVSASSPMMLKPGVTLSLSTNDWGLCPVTLVTNAVSGNAWSLTAGNDAQTPVRVNYDSLGGNPELTLGGHIEIVNTVPVAVLRVAAGADVKAPLAAGTKVVNDGGTLEAVESWKGKVALWLDASKAGSFTYAKDHLMTIDWEAVGVPEKTAPDGYLYEWADCRSWQRDVSLRAVVYDNFRNKPAYAQTVFPVVASDGGAAYIRWTNETAGKPRLTLGGRDRTLLNPNNVTLHAALIVAVFSAQDGGGTAMFMEQVGALKRTDNVSSNTSSKDWPICLDTAVSARTNGVAVTVASTGFTGGWQLVTLSRETALGIIGLGHAVTLNTGTGNGGQSYKEILIFTETPSSAERAAAEAYLAEKWNLPIADDPAAAGGTLAAAGSGTVRLTSDVALDATSYYEGMIDLNGKRLEIGTVNLPYTAAEIPSANRLLWVDPRLEGAVVFGDDPAKTDEVKTIYTRDNNGLLTADGSYCLTSPYMTGAENANNNMRVRFIDGWLNFRNGYTADDTRGNVLLMQKLPTTTMERFFDPAETFDTVSAGFFALNSSQAGGGSFMLSAVNGRTSVLLARDVGGAIWRLTPDSTITIDTRLNGETVAMSDTLSGGEDVLSFNVNGADALPVKCFGYANTDQPAYANREILGEWLLYSQNVGADDRAGIEAYLAKKWQGVILPGFQESRDLTVTGAGVIAVADPAALPKLGGGFAGTVEITGDTFSFTLPQTGSAAVDAVAFSGQTVTMPAEVTIDIDARAAEVGTYLLMSAGTFAEGTSFSLGTVTDHRPRSIKLKKIDNALYAEIVRAGLFIYVR